MKKPKILYDKLIENRSDDKIKYKQINTNLRSEEKYNEIPYYVRNKNIKHFKLLYKRYRKDLKIKFKVKKNINNTDILVWPGE